MEPFEVTFFLFITKSLWKRLLLFAIPPRFAPCTFISSTITDTDLDRSRCLGAAFTPDMLLEACVRDCAGFAFFWTSVRRRGDGARRSLALDFLGARTGNGSSPGSSEKMLWGKTFVRRRSQSSGNLSRNLKGAVGNNVAHIGC